MSNSIGWSGGSGGGKLLVDEASAHSIRTREVSRGTERGSVLAKRIGRGSEPARLLAGPRFEVIK